MTRGRAPAGRVRECNACAKPPGGRCWHRVNCLRRTMMWNMRQADHTQNEAIMRRTERQTRRLRKEHRQKAAGRPASGLPVTLRFFFVFVWSLRII